MTGIVSSRRMRTDRPTVDTTHLLSKHDSRSSIVCSPQPGDSEAILHSTEVVVFTDYSLLLLEHDVGIVVVPGGNDGMGPNLDERPKGFFILAILHEPSRRFGGEIDTDHEDE